MTIGGEVINAILSSTPDRLFRFAHVNGKLVPIVYGIVEEHIVAGELDKLQIIRLDGKNGIFNA